MSEIRDHQMPHGITRISMDFIKANSLKIGEIIAVKIAQDEELDFKTSIIGTSGTIVTDGFAIGYGGEGPTGLRTTLRTFSMLIDKQPSEVRLEKGEAYIWYVNRPSIKFTEEAKNVKS